MIRLEWFGFAVSPLLLLAIGLLVVLAMLPMPHEAEERALCDCAVRDLLTSKDLVEVTRAGIIVRELRCGIGRRLDRAAAAP